MGKLKRLHVFLSALRRKTWQERHEQNLNGANTADS